MSEVSLKEQIDYVATQMRELESYYNAKHQKHGTEGLREANINIPANYNMFGAIKHSLLKLQELANSPRQELKVIRKEF
jgi:hypothetical protein